MVLAIFSHCLVLMIFIHSLTRNNPNTNARGRRFLNATAACLKPMIDKTSLFLGLCARACEINSSIFKIISL